MACGTCGSKKVYTPKPSSNQGKKSTIVVTSLPLNKIKVIK